MKNIYFLLLFLISFNSFSQSIKILQDGDYYGYEVKTTWGYYYIPSTFEYVDSQGNVHWNNTVHSRLLIKDDVVISTSNINYIITNDHKDIIFLASTGQLPKEWTIHDLNKRVYDNSHVFFVVIGKPIVYDILVSYLVRLPNGMKCKVFIFEDEKRIAIFED